MKIKRNLSRFLQLVLKKKIRTKSEILTTFAKEQIKKLASIIQEDEIQQRIDIFSKKTPKALNKYMHKNFQNQISLPQGFAGIDSLNEVLNLRKDKKKCRSLQSKTK